MLADRRNTPARFLVLGSAAGDLLRQSSESLPGRVERLTLGGFHLSELDDATAAVLWLRGGLPRSCLAANDADSTAWRRNFIQPCWNATCHSGECGLRRPRRGGRYTRTVPRSVAGGGSILFAAVALALSAPVAAEAQALGQLYIEALDAEGQVVPDLTVRDFIVLEDDTRARIVSAERVGPLKVALLVDNGDRMSELAAFYPLRDAIGAFLDTLGPEHEVALFTIARSIERRVDFTLDRGALRASTEEIVLDSGAGVLLLDGIEEIWERGYEGDETLPALVLILTDGPEGSRNYSDTEYADLVETLIFNGVMVNVLQLSGRAGSIRGGNISTLPQYARSIADNTGGMYETIVTATGMPEWMERYAERLNAHHAEMSKRYRVRYEPPDPRGARISAGARAGVNIRLFVDVRMQP